MSERDLVVTARDGEPIRCKDWHDMQSGLRARLHAHDHSAKPLPLGVFPGHAALTMASLEADKVQIGGQDLRTLLGGCLAQAGGEVAGDVVVRGDLLARGRLTQRGGTFGSGAAPIRRELDYVQFDHTVSRQPGTHPSLLHNGRWALLPGLSAELVLPRCILSMISSVKPGYSHGSGPVLQHAVALEDQVIPLHAFATIQPASRDELLRWARDEAVHYNAGWRAVLDAGYGALGTPHLGIIHFVQWVELPPGEYTVGLAAMGQGHVREATFMVTSL